MSETIYEQLRDYCDCFRQSDVKDTEKFERNVNQLVDIISMITCWKNTSCENFLSSDRQEVLDIHAIKSCYCDDGLMIVDLNYREIQSETIVVKLQKRTGIQFETITLDSSEYTYNEYENKLYIDLSNYNIKCCCDCTKLHKLIITYTAGYELIPDCLLPVFCDFLQYIIQYNRCCCECSTCQDDTEETVEDDGNIPDSISEYIQNTIFVSYARQLETISLCGYRKQFVGMVV